MMLLSGYHWLNLLILLGVSLLPSICLAQRAATTGPVKRTEVTILSEKGDKITQLAIELQGAPNNMEPVAEPVRIRVDDRAQVRLLLVNLSPFDVCTLNGRTPTPTAETSVAEALVGTIAKLGGIAVGTSTSNLYVTSARQQLALLGEEFAPLPNRPTPSDCHVLMDPEYKRILAFEGEFFDRAERLIGQTTVDGKCRNSGGDQVELACEIDFSARRLADYAGADYRGKLQQNFKVESEDLKGVRDTYSKPLVSIIEAGKLQAIVDEMATWAGDLHKKFDFAGAAADSGSPSPTPAVAGTQAVSAAPTTLAFVYSPSGPGLLTQTIHVSAAGAAAPFTATASSGRLHLSAGGGTTPNRGTFDIIVTADSSGLNGGTDNGTITISGTGPITGTTIVNVTLKPSPLPTTCDLDRLRQVDEIVDRAKAELSLLSDNNKTLEAAQTTLKASYLAIVKVSDDFKRRRDQKIVVEDNGILIQKFNLGTDRKGTVTGNISCVSDVDGKTATTDTINFSILYQEVPHWTLSAGLLTSLLEKKVIGVANESVFGSSPPAALPFFRVTDRAQVQLVPMAFVNYRLGTYKSGHYGKGREDELVWTGHLSFGLGVNPNTGTNQAEFFFGLALGLNRLLIHPGIHFGRTESLGGGFTLNTQAPPQVSAPITWSYHPAFSIGFSVRVAPY